MPVKCCLVVDRCLTFDLARSTEIQQLLMQRWLSSWNQRSLNLLITIVRGGIGGGCPVVLSTPRRMPSAARRHGWVATPTRGAFSFCVLIPPQNTRGLLVVVVCTRRSIVLQKNTDGKNVPPMAHSPRRPLFRTVVGHNVSIGCFINLRLSCNVMNLPVYVCPGGWIHPFIPGRAHSIADCSSARDYGREAHLAAHTLD